MCLLRQTTPPLVLPVGYSSDTATTDRSGARATVRGPIRADSSEANERERTQMGGTISVCGLRAGDDRDLQLVHFARDADRPAGERGRSLSSATDSSVVSILSNSEQLVPDAFLPKDIQVLSQRRQRHGHHHHLASRSSYAYSGKNSSRGSSRVSSNASSRGAGTVRVVRNHTDAIPASISKNITFGMKTASSSFGYSDDDEAANPAAGSRRVDNSSLSVQELRVK
ncbi:unnamed protein product [Phytophthora lilii]|uniref:Unnamed protein product n=1 Tax=Phytophthora lilii TaxID=2077276 RepID=A0A9W6WUG3_9STRA|nr:unnamed protein product [Phytophthora lilii]